jgi:hypothetical protein
MYANGWEVIYSAKQAAATATRATTTRGDESAPAPFLLREALLLGVAVDEEAADDEELVVPDPGPPARTVAATSIGNIGGLLSRGLRSTAPLEEIVSAFIPRKDLVKRTFSIAYD